MADGVTYGLAFPFENSNKGDYLLLTETQFTQIRSDLIHLLLTKKGSRYYLPTFGTRLYEFLFEPFDGLTFDAIEADIRDSVQQFMPNLDVKPNTETAIFIEAKNRYNELMEEKRIKASQYGLTKSDIIS
jgi:phage baseplate assembly protein W